METMSTGLIDPDTKRYGRPLAKALPAVVKSEDENDRMLAIVEGLMAKGDENLTRKKTIPLDLLEFSLHGALSSRSAGYFGNNMRAARCNRVQLCSLLLSGEFLGSFARPA